MDSSLNITQTQAEIPSYQSQDQISNQISAIYDPTYASTEYTNLPSNTSINLLSQLAARPFSVIKAVKQAENIIINQRK